MPDPIRTKATFPEDALYASNGARPDAAHYSVDIEQAGRFKWRWSVVHWPAMYRGSNGPVYPGIDWRENGWAATRDRARAAAEKAIALRREELSWRDNRESFDVVA